MTLYDLTMYVLILLSVTLAPGPLMAIVIARTLSRDIKGALAVTIGMASGDVLIIALIYAGLAAWLQEAPAILMAAKIGGMAYLLWLARDMWTGSDAKAEMAEPKGRSVAGSAAFGFSSCFFTPHSILLYLVLLPQLMDISTASVVAISLFCALTFGALVAAFGTVIFVTAKVKLATTKSGTSRFVSRALALVIALSGVWMVAA